MNEECNTAIEVQKDKDFVKEIDREKVHRRTRDRRREEGMGFGLLRNFIEFQNRSDSFKHRNALYVDN